MLQVVTFVTAHWGTLVAIFAILGTLALVFDQLAKVFASFGWHKAAHACAAIATQLPQWLAFAARMIALFSGRPFEVPGGTPAASPQTALPPNASLR